MTSSDFFSSIKTWILEEHLKPSIQKRKDVLNRTLVISGASGVGKSTFVKFILEPVFKTGALFLNNQFQPPGSITPETSVFYSPDNASIKDLYNYTLVANGEYPIDSKGE